MNELQTEIPRPFMACVAVAYGFHLWRLDGKPEVWRRVPFKPERNGDDATPAHWVKIPSLDDISRQDARMELKAAWEEAEDWRKAHT